MVLSMSLWDDHAANALWLDSSYPTTADPSKPGIARGPCATTSGVPADVEKNVPNSSVTFSNIRWGDINTTFTNVPGGSSSSSATTSKPTSSSSSTTKSSSSTSKTTSASPSPTSGGTVPHYGQCGGQTWTGGTVCVSPYKCTVSNPCAYNSSIC
jgi:cellulose 1,4-beta-cellobiosidase